MTTVSTLPARLPAGITPRLLARDAAAAYCGVITERFEKHIRPYVKPVEIGSRVLWDIKALDRWLDQQSGLDSIVQPVEEWLKRLD
jgi:hypothetical protein